MALRLRNLTANCARLAESAHFALGTWRDITRVEHGDCSARYWSARVSPACVCAKDLTPGASAVGLPASPPPAGDHLRSRYAISNGSPI